MFEPCLNWNNKVCQFTPTLCTNPSVGYFGGAVPEVATSRPSQQLRIYESSFHQFKCCNDPTNNCNEK